MPKSVLDEKWGRLWQFKTREAAEAKLAKIKKREGFKYYIEYECGWGNGNYWLHEKRIVEGIR